MKLREFVLPALVVGGLAVVLYLLIPSGLGIKGQLRWLFQGAVWLVTLVVGFFIWLGEAIVLFIGPWFFGWAGRWSIKKVDERFSPESDMARWQGILLNAGLVVVMFLLWIFVALTITWIPPISQHVIGPWIRSHVETGLVWWGVYGALSYMLFSPLRAFAQAVWTE